jgi:hypothetical protein
LEAIQNTEKTTNLTPKVTPMRIVMAWVLMVEFPKSVANLKEKVQISNAFSSSACVSVIKLG